MIELLLAALLVCAALCLLLRSLIASVIVLAVFSLLSTLLYFLLKAPDVAIAEAAVGAGVSTMVFIWAVGRTKGGARDESESTVDR
jgi:uncharacterized MnhB-related membrane protein